MYEEDELLQLSGIQHFAFCPRQWALIHIERLWEENILTTEGRFLHEKVDNPFIVETSGSVVVARAVPIVSYELGLRGKADVVEYVQASDGENAVFLERYGGYWFPFPVEYKRGRPKKDDRDAVQLCAQALCLEEMHQVQIECGYIYYGRTKHRTQINFSATLRDRVKELSAQMHGIFREGTTPPGKPGTNCSPCSLKDVCLPKLSKRRKSAVNYLTREINRLKAESCQDS